MLEPVSDGVGAERRGLVSVCRCYGVLTYCVQRPCVRFSCSGRISGPYTVEAISLLVSGPPMSFWPLFSWLIVRAFYTPELMGYSGGESIGTLPA